ncbi:MAG: acyltransferase family protein [Planktotalea sp.]|uniref:acyltransferase family protein n=1 Tax=Planktotalea sp. TaxID=2029877 RepID=UPI003C749367
MSSHTPPLYRPEIDGLRSIAVLAVVLYHFGVSGLQGGFVGVDVFFVISGFLIGGLLWREGQGTGAISLKRFYMRRIKRLAPAYVSMAVTALFVGYVVLLPFEFREFGKSLIAATVYLSNVNFFREAGYFDSASEDKVLLHTWSLSVEEQFYIVLPILMVVLLRRPLGLRVVLWLSFWASLIACIWITQRSQPAAFYLFPFRAWELLAGVLLAIESQRRTLQEHSALSFAGLALVLGGILFIPAGAQFPGWHAIFPVLGTVLLIANGQHENIVNRSLRSPLPVGIGLISYSLYLWHWPVLTLSSYYRDGYAGGLEVVFWLSLSFLLAYLSWRFVERPFRRSTLPPWPTFGVAAFVSGALVAAGGLLFIKDGMIERFAPPLRTHIDASADFLQDWSRCTVPATGPFAGLETCPIGPEETPDILIWGDSHVRALKEGLELAAYEANAPALLIWRAGCAPVFGLTKDETSATPAQDNACTDANVKIEAALREDVFARVLLVGRWGYYSNGGGVGLDAGNLIAAEIAGMSGAQSEQISSGLGLTTGALQDLGSKVFVLSAIPEIPDYDSRKIARALAGHRLSSTQLDDAVQTPRSNVEARAMPLEKAFQKMAAQGITILDPAPYFCTDTHCSALHEGKAQYFDNNHIINAAALRIRSLFADVFTNGAAQ